MTNKHMRRCSVLLTFKEMQIKIARYHGTPIRMFKIKKIMTTQKADEDTKKLGQSYITGGKVKWSSHSEKQFGSFLKT